MLMMRGCLCLACVFLATANGCSKGVSLKTVPVTGKVTLDGKPLSGATVTFLQASPGADGSGGAPSSGITGADGSYKLITMASGRDIVDGAPPGNYKVSVTKQSSAPAAPPGGPPINTNDPEKMQKMSPEELNKMRGGAPPGEAPASTPKPEIPLRYSNVDTSGFAATVGASGTQTFDFPLTSE